MSPDPLSEAAARRHELTRAKAVQALRELDRAGAPVTFARVAQEAGISRSWLYTQPDISSQIRGCARKQMAPAPPAPFPPGSGPPTIAGARLAAALDQQATHRRQRPAPPPARPRLGDQRSARTRSGNDPER